MAHVEDPRSLDSQAAVVALLKTAVKGQRWSEISDRVLASGSAQAVWADRDDALFADPGRDAALTDARTELHRWQEQNWRFVSILDEDYPARLRDIHQAPPFLFAAGELRPIDVAIAVVGSRKASAEGLSFAREVARLLAAAHTTVLSGLAAGIDSAAHRAALADGGRTVAVIGTGIGRTYPAENADLQAEIARRGLVLSQFWPDGPPQPHNFLMRNAVMSGYGHGTVVVEAGEQSGARAQARMAVEHGRPVVLTEMVVQRNQWAKNMVDRPQVFVARTPEDVLTIVGEIRAEEESLATLLRSLVGSGE